MHDIDENLYPVFCKGGSLFVAKSDPARSIIATKSDPAGSLFIRIMTDPKFSGHLANKDS